jgi:hypothetical protein
MKTILSILGALAIAGILSGNAVAQQYKWTDKNGKVQYGDTPPPGVNATPLKGSSVPPPAPADKGASRTSAKDAKEASKGPLTPAEQDAEFRKRKLEAEKAGVKDEKAAQDADARRDNCKNAQDYQRQLEGGQRIARTDAKGERYYIDDEQRAAELTKTRKMLGEWCK